MLVEEEGKLKKIKDRSIHLTFQKGCSKTKVGNKKKDKASLIVNDGKVHEYKYFFKDGPLQEGLSKTVGLL